MQRNCKFNFEREARPKNNTTMSNGITIKNIGGSRIITVNGNHSMNMIDGKWFIDGKEVDIHGDLHELAELDMKQVNLTINGNVGSIHIGQIGSVTVNGDVDGNIFTTNGSVNCEDIYGNVTANNGSVKALTVNGDAIANNGNVCGL